jgi:DNA invertase Pin-like site-specific DNA recombinase
VDDALPTAGAASLEIAKLVQETWLREAAKSGINLDGFDPSSSLADRIAWARGKELAIGSALSRFSSKLQHSTAAQISDCVLYAARHGIYLPPEYVCVDEAVSGRKTRRDGLIRIKSMLKGKLAEVLLVFKVSRLFRVAYRGFQFFQEEVVEEGLRAVSISQGIDTADEKTWKQLAYLHGIMDEMLLSSIADHVRSGIADLFRQGYVTGALPVGFRAKPVPGAPLTNRGKPRTIPEVDPAVKPLIIQHLEWSRDGMPIREGWRRWVAANGPCDPRSAHGRMSYGAYRRMLSNPRLTGVWAFGCTRSVWSSKRDYALKVERPAAEVITIRSEELRIVDDELFLAVQERLMQLKIGPRGPKRRKHAQLWDLVTDCFYCAHCSTPDNSVRFYQAGANGHGMRCKNSALCGALSVVRRKEAVCAVCERLRELLVRDGDLIDRVINSAVRLDAAGDPSVQDQISQLEKQIAALENKIEDLTEMAGEGSPEDRARRKGKVREACGLKATKEVALLQLLKSLHDNAEPITAQHARAALDDLTGLLAAGASGKLGEDVIFRAADVFRQLVGGRILVHVERRAARKRTNVYGTFRPHLLGGLQKALAIPASGDAPVGEEERVWLRKRPKRDCLAERVYQLFDVENKSYREIAKILQAEGENINSGVVWQIRQRYFEMLGLPTPTRTYAPRRPGRSA